MPSTDYGVEADERFIRWVTIGCPKCSVVVQVLDIPALPALILCGVCVDHPRLEATAT
jgi:hypothetical protein